MRHPKQDENEPQFDSISKDARTTPAPKNRPIGEPRGLEHAALLTHAPAHIDVTGKISS